VIGLYELLGNPIKTSRHDIAKILLKVALNTTNQIKSKSVHRFLFYPRDLLFVNRTAHPLIPTLYYNCQKDKDKDKKTKQRSTNTSQKTKFRAILSPIKSVLCYEYRRNIADL
jgi:hypothetical protein